MKKSAFVQNHFISLAHFHSEMFAIQKTTIVRLTTVKWAPIPVHRTRSQWIF